MSFAKRPAVFFDRDGVLNVDKGYINHKEDFQWIPGAPKAIKKLNDFGYLVFVITNQSGIARGYYPEESVIKLHEYMNEELSMINARIDAFYYCPHHTEGKIKEYTIECNCRKPLPGMILQAFEEWEPRIDKEKSFAVGDKERDLEAATAAGISSYLFEGGNLNTFVNDIFKKTNSN